MTKEVDILLKELSVIKKSLLEIEQRINNLNGVKIVRTPDNDALVLLLGDVVADTRSAAKLMNIGHDRFKMADMLRSCGYENTVKYNKSKGKVERIWVLNNN